MKKRLISCFCLLGIFLVSWGWSLDTVPNFGINLNQKRIALIQADLNTISPDGLLKRTADYRNGLSDDDLIKFFNWRKKKVKKIILKMYSERSEYCVGLNKYLDTIFTVPLVNGRCSTLVNIPEKHDGCYTISAVSLDESQTMMINEFLNADGKCDVLSFMIDKPFKPNIILNSDSIINVSLSLYAPDNNFIEGNSYKLTSNSPGFYNCKAVFENGYLVTDFFFLREKSLKARASFKVDGQDLLFDFDIMDVLDNNVVDARVLNSGNTVIKTGPGKKIDFKVSRTSPSNNERDVELNLAYVAVDFENNLKSVSGMPNFHFTITQSDGGQRIEGFLIEDEGNSLTKRLNSETKCVTLKANTDYTVKVGGLLDLYDNEMAESFDFRFTTGNWYKILASNFQGSTNDTLLRGDTLRIYVPGAPKCANRKMILKKNDTEITVEANKDKDGLEFYISNIIPPGRYGATFQVGEASANWFSGMRNWAINIK